MTKIRPCTDHDLAQLEILVAAVWQDTYAHLVGAARIAEINHQDHTVEQLRIDHGHADRTALVVEEAGELIGYGLVQDGHPAILERLYILPGQHRKGLGKALLNALEQAVAGAQELVLEVEIGNEKAQAFYKAQGFEMLDGCQKCGCHDDITANRMRKVLGDH